MGASRFDKKGRRFVKWLLGLALTVTALSGILHWVVAPPTGLVRSFYSDVDFAGDPLVQDRTTEVSLAFLDRDPTLPRRFFSVQWRGYWYLPEAQTVTVYAGADDRVDVLVDGTLVLRRNFSVGTHTIGETIALGAGAHEVVVRYEQEGGAASLNLQRAFEGTDAGTFLPTRLFPESPDIQDFRLANATYWLTRLATVLWLAPLGGLFFLVAGRVSRRVGDRWRAADAPRTIGGVWRSIRGVSFPERVSALAEAPVVLACCVWGSLLRLEALVAGYGAVPGLPQNAQRALASLTTYLHPSSVSFPHDIVRGGDPIAYLNNARAMTWFYEGRAREPLFNYATKLMLRVTGDADIGVSLASVSFSILCVPAAYFLGRVALGRAAGLLAAIVVAIEPDLIRWGVQGWRDDAFTFFVGIFVAAGISVLKERTASRLALLSLAGAGAILVRLTALSFVVPAFAIVLWHAWREGPQAPRRSGLIWVGLSAGAVFVLVIPYLVNCWLVFGDPLVAVNRNTRYYRANAGLDASQSMSTRAYLQMLATERPVATVDQVLQGFTIYPFTNKWHALESWKPGFGLTLRALALAGLLVWPWTARGRFLLVMLFASMLPYVFTWHISAEWRFTMHTYPLYLTAAGFALTHLLNLALPPWEFPTWRRIVRVGPRAIGSIATLLLFVALLAWLPLPRFREAMRAGQATHIGTGWQDRVFFPRDAWYPRVERERIPVRLSKGRRVPVRLGLEPGRGYRLDLRVFPALPLTHAGMVTAFVRDAAVAQFRVGPGTSETGWHSFEISEAAVGTGVSEIELEANFGFATTAIDPVPAGAVTEAKTAIAVIELWVHPD